MLTRKALGKCSTIREHRLFIAMEIMHFLVRFACHINDFALGMEEALEK